MSAISTSTDTSKGVRRRRLRLTSLREQLTGYLFIAPAVLLIALFGLFPIGYAFYMSLHRWRVRQGGFIGFANYERALGDWGGALLFVAGLGLLALAYVAWNRAFAAHTRRGLLGWLIPAILLIGAGLTIALGWGRMSAAGDERFLNSLPITLYYALGTVPIQISLALVLAYLLFQRIRGRELFRMIFFLPYITPVVATAVVFRIIFSPRDTSLANQALALLGLPPQEWLFEPQPLLELLVGQPVEGFFAGPSLALVSVIMYGIWSFVGYNAVIFLAGLGSIPGSLYEAAEIDGANGWQLFRHITIPMLSPVTFYLALVGFIGTFKAFNHIYVMRVPSAQGTTDVASIVIFDTFYKASQFGYATAEAILLFLIILGLTLAQNKIFGSRVFYE